MPDDLEHLRADWTRLAAGTSTFCSWEWASAMRAHVWPAAPPRIEVVERRGAIVGLLPLMGRRYGPGGALREWRFLGDPLADYGDVLAGGDPTVAAGLLSAAATRRGWHRIVLDGFPADSPHLGALLSAARDLRLIVRREQTHVCPTINLAAFPDWETYFHTRRSTSSRKTLRRQERLLGEAGRLQRVHLRAPFGAAWLAHVERLNTARQRDRGGLPLFQRPGVPGLVRQLNQTLGERLVLDALTLDDRPIAYALGFDEGTTYAYWNVAHDPALDRFSPGSTLLMRLIESAFGRYQTFDFLRGQETYKSAWATAERPTITLTLYRASGPYLLDIGRRRLADAIKRHAPPGLARRLRDRYGWETAALRGAVRSNGPAQAASERTA